MARNDGQPSLGRHPLSPNGVTIRLTASVALAYFALFACLTPFLYY